jgi:hypothetical protein
MCPSVNFYHPSGRKFPPSVLNQACSCEVYHESHLDNGHRSEVAASEAKVCPVRAAPLASLSGSRFPQTAVVSPSGALSSA